MAGPLDLACINTIRFLSVDAVQKANSGHPGLPQRTAHGDPTGSGLRQHSVQAVGRYLHWVKPALDIPTPGRFVSCHNWRTAEP